MGIPVTVDSEMLEVLIRATGCVKAMEAAVQAASNDPLRKRAVPALTAAHDYLAGSLRRAYRARDGYVRAPHEKDLAKLRQKFVTDEGHIKGYADFDQNPTDLAGCALIWVGAAYKGVKVEWAAPESPEFMHDGGMPFYRARLTDAGRSHLEEMLAAEKKETAA